LQELIEFTRSQFEHPELSTRLFKSILVATPYDDDDVLKAVEAKAKDDPMYYIPFYNGILKKYLDVSMAALKAEETTLEDELTKLKKYQQDLITPGAKVMKLPDVEYPYKQRPGWALDPKHSGIVQLKPIVVSAIAEAKKLLTTNIDKAIPKGYVKFSEIDFELLQNMDTVNVMLAKLVACCMAFPSINFPDQFRFMKSGEMAERNQAGVMNELRRVRIKREGKRKYTVTVEAPQKRLKF
jgi:hypothetical protein